ncbi:meprin A subunit alpha [Esox lucius]|uniref:Meprin A subunit n=1 Tax=Esox lucius TaxID=8010 RepID=A0A3P8XHA3_ESOLU|nr:meprin A subunit alpha [Esox lucius]
MGQFTIVVKHISNPSKLNMEYVKTQGRITILITILVVFKVHAVPTLYGGDADGGELRDDIPEINSDLDLFEGDIAGDPRRNAILDETRRWKFPIPYILTDSLELNAKGVIHQAFEAYRLKSCVDFKPYEGESTYISFTKLEGCWSFVGDDKIGQNLSIGAGCDTKAIVEHELLHALGFFHEQSRSDRDDYVKIWWDQIIEGKEHNFKKYEADYVTDLNTPYDYESVMHYRPLSFNKNPSTPTITTAIPSFNDLIGQRLDFSSVDLLRLNRMYDCSNTQTLLDQCSFELINVCGMVQSEADDADWVQTLSSSDEVDHTLVGRCRDAGHFMKFDTSKVEVETSAILESRILYPKRSAQCLQFFYKMSGPAGDKLVVWVRTDDGTGNVSSSSKIHTITDSVDDTWQPAYVNLHMKRKFRYIFQGVGGSNNTSAGAILIDDITLTETTCPSGVWKIRNFTGLLATMPTGERIRSRRFYSPEGYAYGVNIYPNGRNNNNTEYVGVTFHLCSGENDGMMEWPVINRQATITAMDQDSDAKLRMSATRSFTTETTIPNWIKPSSTSGADWDPSCDCYRGPEYGWSTFISHKQLQRRSFLKNNDLIFTVDFDDLTHLVKSEVSVKPKSPSTDLLEEETRREEIAEVPKRRQVRAVSKDACNPNPCHNSGVCVLEKQGKATCRCISGQATYYAGELCEKQHIDGTILGILSGGAAGTIVLTLAIFSVIRRPH